MKYSIIALSLLLAVGITACTEQGTPDTPNATNSGATVTTTPAAAQTGTPTTANDADRAKSPTEQAKQATEDTADAATAMGNQAWDATTDTAKKVGDQAADVGKQALDSVGDAAADAGDTVNSALDFEDDKQNPAESK